MTWAALPGTSSGPSSGTSPDATPSTTHRRLFFALWPDPELRSALVERGDALGDRLGPTAARRVPASNLHLTLLFLGDVPVDQVRSVEDVGDSVADDGRHRSFTLELDRYGVFDRARVAWWGGPAVKAGARLVDDLAAGAAARGLPVDRREWRPHVTLFRRVDGRTGRPDSRADDPGDPTPSAASIDWHVGGFVLVESIRSRPYQLLRSWGLE